MTSDDDSVPLEACALPGMIEVTRAALDLAEQFQEAVPAGWIATFSWHDGERIRSSKDLPWEDRGPGIGLGAYRLHEIPKEAVCHAGALRYAVLIRKEIVESHPQRTIDLEASGKLVFR